MIPYKQLLNEYVSQTLINFEAACTAGANFHVIPQMLNSLMGILVFCQDSQWEMLMHHIPLGEWLATLPSENDGYALDYRNPGKTPAEQHTFFLLTRLKNAITGGNIKALSEDKKTISHVRFSDFDQDKYRDTPKRTFKIQLAVSELTILMNLIRDALTATSEK